MMYFVYVLYSLKDHRLYKGFTSNLVNRLAKHNSGGSKSTSHRRPFVLVHVEQFDNKKEALQRESYLKTLEGGASLNQALIKLNILRTDGMLNVAQW